MKRAERVLLIPNLCLAAGIVGVGCAIWLARSERTELLRQHEQASARAAADRPKTKDIRRASAGGDSTASSPAESPVSDEYRRVIQATVERQERLAALNRYRGGLVALGISPDITAQAKEIILEGRKAAAEARRAAPSADAAWLASVSANRAMEERLSALLGAEAFEHLKAYSQEDRFDWSIGTDMWDGGAPLSGEQLHALTLAIVRIDFQDTQAIMQPTADDLPDSTTGLSRRDEMLLAAVSPSLTPEQLAILRQSLREDHRYNAAMRGFGEKQRQLWLTK